MNTIFEEIKRDLSVNFDDNDNQVLDKIINRVITDALFISNRNKNDNNISILKSEIIECVKTIYLQRGSEDVTSQSQSGISNNFKDAIETMRKNIILNGKRLIK